MLWVAHPQSPLVPETTIYRMGSSKVRVIQYIPSALYPSDVSKSALQVHTPLEVSQRPLFEHSEFSFVPSTRVTTVSNFPFSSSGVMIEYREWRRRTYERVGVAKLSIVWHHEWQAPEVLQELHSPCSAVFVVQARLSARHDYLHRPRPQRRKSLYVFLKLGGLGVERDPLRRLPSKRESKCAFIRAASDHLNGIELERIRGRDLARASERIVPFGTVAKTAIRTVILAVTITTVYLEGVPLAAV